MPAKVVNLNVGKAWCGNEKPVLVGDRYFPPKIEVEFPGDENQPALHMTIEVVDGVPVCSELRLTKKPGGAEVRSKDLSVVRIEDWMQVVLPEFSMPGELMEGGGLRVSVRDTSREDVLNVQRARQEATTRKRKITREHLEQVAQIYREHFDHRPRQAIARAFGTSEPTAGRWVTLCREEGLLPPTSPGRKAK